MPTGFPCAYTARTLKAGLEGGFVRSWSRALVLVAAWSGLHAALLSAQVRGEPPAAAREEVPPFFVRQVTTGHPHRAVCLVCRYGDRPVVLVALRRITPRVRKWLCRLDHLVQEHRLAGLRGFVLFLGKDLPYWQPRLVHLARAHGLKLPLVLPVQWEGPDQLAFAANVPVTVVLYRRRRVRRRLHLELDQLGPEHWPLVRQAVLELLKPPPAAAHNRPGERNDNCWRNEPRQLRR